MIGVFDSGLGGLTILKAIIKELPKYDYVYLGDNARVPYGARSSKIIYQYSYEGVDYLFRKGARLVILACNTASANALRKLQEEYLPKNYPERRILGVIRPSVESAIEKSFNTRVGVIGTEATVNSGIFPKEFLKLKPDFKIYQEACPLLVPIIEAGEIDWSGLDLILDKYLANLKRKDLGALILGCTHYSLIKNKIQKHIGKGVRLVAEDEIVPLKLKEYLLRHPEIEENLGKQGRRSFLITAESQRFEELAKTFWGDYLDFQLVDLADF